jgi:hypothetical protein
MFKRIYITFALAAYPFVASAIELKPELVSGLRKQMNNCKETGLAEETCACRMGGRMFAIRSPLVYTAPGSTREDDVAVAEDVLSKSGARCAVSVGMAKDWAEKDKIPGCIDKVKTSAHLDDATARTACACILGSDIAARAFRDGTDAPSEKVQEEKRLDADVCVSFFGHTER